MSMKPAAENPKPPLADAIGSAIKRCPFCGSAKVAVRFYNQPSVVCADCLCMGPAARRLTKVNKEQCEREAVVRWNHRPDFSHKITLAAPNAPAQRPPATNV